MPDQSFKKASTLPPYIFGEINSLKQKARHAGEDIIDFGMGNPDRETPKPIVEKLIETVKNPATHRYSQSIGLPKLRLAMSDWYLRKYNVSLDHENEIVTCMGSKEGIAHLCMATLSEGDNVLVQSPTYPVHTYGVVIAGATVEPVTLIDDLDSFLNQIKKKYPEKKINPRC